MERQQLPATQSAPPLPYNVKMMPFGPDPPLMRPVKIYNGLAGEILTPKEVAIWESLLWLEAEVARLTAVCSRLESKPERGPEVAEMAAPISDGTVRRTTADVELLSDLAR